MKWFFSSKFSEIGLIFLTVDLSSIWQIDCISPNRNHIGHPMHQVYHTVYKANTGVKEIFGFDLQNEIVESITMKQLVDLSTCIYIETERKKEKKKERKMESISDRLVHIMAKILITCINPLSYHQY